MRQLSFAVCTVLLLLTTVLQAQLTPAVQPINYRVDFVNAQGFVPASNTRNFVSKIAVDNDGFITPLLDRTPGAQNPGSYCYYYTSGTPVDVNIDLLHPDNTSNYLFDFDIMTWTAATGSNCTYPANAASTGFHNTLYNATTGAPNQWNAQANNISLSSSGQATYTLRTAYRYARGTDFNYANASLNFQPLSVGVTRTHINSNRQSPTSLNPGLGYSNNYTTPTFRASPEVIYGFVLTEAAAVTISTNYAETNFNTHLTLVDNPGGFSYVISRSDDINGSNNKSELTANLCAGTYFIAVEGSAQTDVGDFKLSVSAQTLTLDGGSIVSVTGTPICKGSALPSVGSMGTGTVISWDNVNHSTVLDTYGWERSINGGTFQYWSAPSSPSLSNPGLMGGGDTATIAFRRYKMNICTGGRIYSNTVTFTAAMLTGGNIVLDGSSPTVPSPQEEPLKFKTGTTNPTSNLTPSFFWQRKEENGNWSKNIFNNSLSYQVTDTLSATPFNPYYTRHYIRRVVVNGCVKDSAFSNIIEIKALKTNGRISGRVTSRNGSGVKGVTITVQKKTASLPGSPQTFQYTGVTGDDGSYSIQPMYFGDFTANPSLSTEFVVTPSKAPGHIFNYTNLSKTLTDITPQLQDVDFEDWTVFSIRGRVTQECTACLDLIGNQSCPVDSVQILNNNTHATYTAYDNASNEFGRYTITVDNQGTYSVKPVFKNHQFSPLEDAVAVTDNVDNRNFKDTTTRIISGSLKAGCNDYIGTAVLEFEDVLPNDANGNPRGSCFKARVTTNGGSGSYSIRLPARKYRVKVIDFTPDGNAGINKNDLLAFFTTNVHADSLVRDITSENRSLNLIYQRPPSLAIVGMDSLSCNGTKQPFVLMEQAVNALVTFNVYQGESFRNCPLKGDSVIVSTNLSSAVTQTNKFYNDSGFVKVLFTPGEPKITGDYFKTLNVQYKDTFQRVASPVYRNILVTGIKSDIGSFVTVSPEIPLLVLHDPPGDKSYSFWESNKTVESAVRLYAAKSKDVNTWAEVKLGAKWEAGLFLSREFSVWGQVKSTVTVGSRNMSQDQVIVSSSLTQSFSTANNPEVVGAKGDVFIGAALNLRYAPSTEIKYNTATCSVSSERKLLVADDGFATTYVYSEDHIRNTLIPTLIALRDNVNTTEEQRRNLINQISVWQQTLSNNDANKKRAVFDHNVSFDGSSGPIAESTTKKSSKSSTVEFEMSLDVDVAAELGLEYGGAGFSTGGGVLFRWESGETRTTDTLKSTTTGYVLDDDDGGDFFSVDVKKDPVYNTPVFELVSGTTSCPYEPTTQPRDEVQLSSPEPVKLNVPENGEAEFILKLGNTSQSMEARTYRLEFVQASNPNGAVVTIGGSPAVGYTSYSIGYGGEVQVTVKVRKGAAGIYSYEGLQFRLYDDCGGGQSKTISLSAHFQSACSGITLVTPEDLWVANSFNKNLLRISFKDYTVANLSNVALEYCKVGTSNWTTAFTYGQGQIVNSVNGTSVDWNIASVADGQYNLRLKLTCAQGVIYSNRVTGTIDRKPPAMIGRPEPTDRSLVAGDVILATYNEKLDCSLLSSANVSVKRVSNNQDIPVELGCYENKISIVPITNVAQYSGDALKITLSGVSDQYGNVKTTGTAYRTTTSSTQSGDTWTVSVGNSTAGTGTAVVNLSLATPTISEDGTGTLDFVFSLPQNASNDMLINFTLSGKALLASDFTATYLPLPQPIATGFSGTQGTIVIKKNTSSATLRIKAVADNLYEDDEKVIVSVNEGGDYLLGNTITQIGTILNDDAPAVFTFIGNGIWTEASNWQNNTVPPSTLPTGNEIIIDPAANGSCLMNVRVTILPGAKLTVAPGKKLVIASLVN